MINQFGIYTSYFAKVMHHPDVKSGKLDPVCIANTQPNGFNLYTDNILTPHRFLVAQLKAGTISESIYRLKYIQLLDERIRDINVINTILKNSVLVCWEAPDKFCHRFVFADWYMQKTGHEIPELQFEKAQQELPF
jgi:hypothetical protein